MLEALLAGCPPGEEDAMTKTGDAGYSVSCTTSLRALDLGESSRLSNPQPRPLLL